MLSRHTSNQIGIIIVGLIAVSASGELLLSPHQSSTLKPRTPSSPYFDYIVVIVMENKNLNQTYGNSCVGNCSYITQLANAYGLAENYSGVAHRSLPNYLTLTSGDNY